MKLPATCQNLSFPQNPQDLLRVLQIPIGDITNSPKDPDFCGEPSRFHVRFQWQDAPSYRSAITSAVEEEGL